LPSLLLSAAEKFGVVELELPEVPPDADEDGSEELDELLSEADGVELLPDADGVELLLDEDDGLVADGVDDDDVEDCATASVDRAKSTAAVVILRVFGMDGSPG